MDARNWRYLAEGNANVVFAYVGPHDPAYSGKVLRVHKVTSKPSFAVLDNHEYLLHVVTQHLGALAQHVLFGKVVSLSTTMLEALENQLELLHEDRSEKFRLSMLDRTESHALLLPSLITTSESLVLEFKPKWLLQSPDAPQGAIMCRTCALKNMRAGGCVKGFCPLDLADKTQDRICKAVEALSVTKGWQLTRMQIAALAEALRTSDVIEQLKDAQARADPDLTLAMTLRDCSIFICIDRKQFSVENIWLTDLDRKSIDNLPLWQSIETRLADGGWYHGNGLTERDLSCL